MFNIVLISNPTDYIAQIYILIMYKSICKKKSVISQVLGKDSCGSGWDYIQICPPTPLNFSTNETIF